MINNKLDKYDKNFLSLLIKLYRALSQNYLNFGEIKVIINDIVKFNEAVEYSYLNDLMYPEKCKGVKIPSLIPVPSCSFQLHNSIKLTPNSSGNLAILFNPFFLANANDLIYDPVISYSGGKRFLDSMEFFSSLYINNDNSLNGISNNNNFLSVDIGQTLPDVYDQYRLVSASITLKYIGKLEDVRGVIGGAIVYDESKYIGGNYLIGIKSFDDHVIKLPKKVKNIDIAKFGNFDLAMDSFYHQENMVLEGIRELYFPIDNSYEEYTKTLGVSQTSVEMYNAANNEFLFKVEDVDNYKSGFNFFIYTLGAPKLNECFKLDIYCNFECLPNSSYLNYLPISVNSGYVSNNDKKSIINIIQEKPISDLKNQKKLSNKPSIWTKLEEKFSGSIPGIKKMGFF